MSLLNFGLGRRLPTLLQTEATECGLACLAMVASYHGYRTTVAELRSRFTVSLAGASLQRLMEIAAALHLQPRPLRLELEELPQLQTPCVLHWNLNHFVVLKRATRKEVVVLDPGLGERRLTWAEVSKAFTGVALELSPDMGFERKEAPPAVRLTQLIGTTRGLGKAAIHTFGLSLLLQATLIATPLYMQWTIDKAILSGDSDLLSVLAIGFLFLVLFQAAIGALRSWAINYFSAHLSLQWQQRIVAKLLRLPSDWFAKRSVGDVVSRMESLRAIQQTLSTGVIEALIDGLMVITTLAMMLLYGGPLVIATLAAVGIYLLIRVLGFPVLMRATEANIHDAAKTQTHVLETVRGMVTVKLNDAEHRRRTGWASLFIELLNSGLRLSNLRLTFQTLSGLTFGIERVVVIWIGALLALNGAITVGMLTAYVAYKDQFSGRVATLIDRILELRALRVHNQRVADIALADEDRALGPAGGGEIALANNELVVEDLEFRFAAGERPVLSGCNARFPQGSTIALIGPSGSGKSTLMRLLLGLAEPTAGHISVGGVGLRNIPRSQYRRLCAAVLQEDQLFAGSIADNIAGFAEGASQATIEAAARLACVHDEIMRMPMGYQTLIGDMGTALSTGQKQRVILARALYRKPKILFLDEATSNLDSASEATIAANLDRLRVTKIIIAHRPATIARADRIYAVESGRLVEVTRSDVASPHRPQLVAAGA